MYMSECTTESSFRFLLAVKPSILRRNRDRSLGSLVIKTFGGIACIGARGQ